MFLRPVLRNFVIFKTKKTLKNANLGGHTLIAPLLHENTKSFCRFFFDGDFITSSLFIGLEQRVTASLTSIQP